MSTYPECEKLLAVEDKIFTIGEFLEWLAEKEIFLKTYVEGSDNGEPKYLPCDGSKEANTWFAPDGMMNNPAYEYRRGGYVSPGKTSDLLYEFFGIDGKKVEEERKAILAENRKHNEQQKAQETTP